MTRRIHSYLFGACCLSILAHSTNAQTVTDNFSVTITIQDACTIVSADDLDFGSVGTLATAVDASSDIVTNCTSGLAYTISLDAGINAALATNTTRALVNGGNAIDYELYQETGRTTVFGSGGGTGGLNLTGSGDNQTTTVFGRVPAQTTDPAGTYTDTIGITVSF